MENILTIDVEEVFHGEYTKNFRNDENVLFRTPYNIPMILNLLDDYGVKATFFIVGEVAERYPKILKEVTQRGHEVAFHSYDHRPLWEKTPGRLEKEIDGFNALLMSVVGEKCRGFRAPSFSLDNGTKWAIKVLEKKDIWYDSSIFPAWTPLYGLPGAPLDPYKPSEEDLTKEDDDGELWEFPLATYKFLLLRFPAAGGFYLRFMPGFVWRAIKKINNHASPAIIYVHNWELDPETPRLKLNFYESFVTYHKIERTLEQFKRLLSSFQFTNFREYMEVNNQNKDHQMDKYSS